MDTSPFFLGLTDSGNTAEAVPSLEGGRSTG